MLPSTGRLSRGSAVDAFRTAVALTATLSFVSCSGAPPSATKRTELAARVDSLVDAYQRYYFAPGVSVAVIRAGRDTLVYRGYGVANVEHDVQATPETVYRIGSITKQFTAAAVMQLAEEERLALDDSIGRYLPELPPAWRAVRIRHLLNHTSGVLRSSDAVRRARRDEVTPDSVVALVRDEPLLFAPGTQWSYSNVGYILLGLLIEEVSGVPYAQYIQTRIAGPLGLKVTRYCDVEPIIKHRAAGYESRDTSYVNAPYNRMMVPFAAGALCSTVGDLAAWNHALAGGRVVSPASWARMVTPEGAARPHGAGYGLYVRSFGGRHAVAHGGAIEGFMADNAYLPEDSLSVTVLTNLGNHNPHELLMDIVRVAVEASESRGAGKNRENH